MECINTSSIGLIVLGTTYLVLAMLSAFGFLMLHGQFFTFHRKWMQYFMAVLFIKFVWFSAIYFSCLLYLCRH